MPSVKEPGFFVNGYGVSCWEEYVGLFQEGRHKKAVGEASTAYLAARESAEWIYRMLGNVKIIVILRNPVERALSLYSWMVMYGYEWIPTFELALAEEEKRCGDKEFLSKSPGYFWDYMYFRSGLYHEQVQRYLKTFDAESVKIYLFEDLIRSPAVIYADVCKFLGVCSDYRPDFVPENRSKMPRSVRLQYWLRYVQTHPPRPNRICRPITRALIPLIMDLNNRLGYTPLMTQQVKKTLRERYREDVTALAELIQKNLSDWLR